MFGVSPAFVVSMFGTQFTVDEFCAALQIVNNLGYDGYQPEVFHKKELMHWKNGGAAKVNTTAEVLGLIPTQFVAHFLMEQFSSPSKISSDDGIDDFITILEIVKTFPQCDTVVVPVGPFELVHSVDGNPNINFNYRTKLKEKTEKFVHAAELHNVKFAIEVLPNSIVEGIEGFLLLSNQINSEHFGLCLDTGHAWASGEPVPLLPLKLQKKIFGLHICDNDSNNNDSLAPGRGTIDWDLFMKSLNIIGYEGSIDIEIICKPTELMDEYLYGKEYLENIIGKEQRKYI